MKPKPSILSTIAVILIGIALFATGCAGTTEENQDRCDNAKAIYTTYLAVAAVRDPSSDEVAAAKAAGAILTAWCGWETPSAGAATKGRGTDKHGVPILIPPQ